MESFTVWQYNEFKQVGKDYSLPAEVEVYDSSHGDFRDIEAEGQAILDTLAVQPTDVLIEFGTGTGTFAIQAARRCAQVYAIDVSETMLDYARAKAARAGIANIIFCHAGFLTYAHPAPVVDAIVTSLAFHHLPDFWKGVALKRLNQMLKPKGQLYLSDVLMEDKKALQSIATFIEQQAAVGGDFLREDAEEHFREEYSTYDWILDGLLTRAGFTIQHKHLYGGVFGSYRCVKAEEVTP
jgi:ubiquinone/menaquinone biosynthesis C-methylase UbiE